MLGLGQTAITLGFPYEMGGYSDANNLPSSVNTGPSWWQNILSVGANTGFSVLRDQFGGPRPGTYVTTPQGTIYRMPEGAANLSTVNLPGIGSGGAGTLLFWGAIGLIAVLAVAKGVGSKN